MAANNLLKWKIADSNNNSEPILVFVTDGSGIDGYRPEFEESLRQAFDEWSTATNGKLAFKFTPDKNAARILVTWSSDLHAPALTAEAGVAKTTCGPGGIEKAEITLLTLDPLKDGPIGRNYLFNVCLHEIGHALGLQGHSPYPEDIMSSTLSIQQGLSPRDIRTMLALYSSTARANAPLPEKDEYGRPLSAKVRAERLAREGAIAANALDYRNAIKYLEEALQLDAGAALAKENLAVALNNLAVSKETADKEAMPLLRLALYWNPKSDAARSNLNALLKAQEHDPQSFAVRVKLAEQCLTANDIKGAIVEFSEALMLKEDAAVRARLKALKPG